MKNQSKTRLGLALGMVMVFSAAHANPQSGWYLGLRGGTATADVDQDALDAVHQDVFNALGAPLFSAESTLEDSDTTWSLFGGYRFNEFLAVEAGYTSLGTTRYFADGTVIAGPFSSSLRVTSFSIDSESRGFSAGLVASLPLGAYLDLHANVGLLFSETKITMNTRGSTILTTLDSQSRLSSSDQDVFYRAGLGCHLSENWSVSLDYQLYNDVGSGEETGENDIDAVTLAAVFRF